MILTPKKRMSEANTCRHTHCVALLLLLLPVLTAATLTNVAPEGTATQSTTAWGGLASKAIDGDRNPNYNDGYCSHTSAEASPWWRLTLPGVYRITAVGVTNRNEAPMLLDNAIIFIGNSAENNGNNNPRCAVISAYPFGQTNTYTCGGMEGRFVNIYLPSSSHGLCLCEVEVFGELVGPLLSGTVMGRNVMLVGKALVWSDALLLCRNAFWDLLSVHSQEEQMELQSLLSNASFPVSKRMWLGLRRYLHGDKWFWMTGESMTYTRLQTASMWQVASPCAGMETRSPYQWRDFPCNHQFHFVCLTDPQAGVDQVEFYSSRNAKA